MFGMTPIIDLLIILMLLIAYLIHLNHFHEEESAMSLCAENIFKKKKHNFTELSSAGFVPFLNISSSKPFR